MRLRGGTPEISFRHPDRNQVYQLCDTSKILLNKNQESIHTLEDPILEPVQHLQHFYSAVIFRGSFYSIKKILNDCFIAIRGGIAEKCFRVPDMN